MQYASAFFPVDYSKAKTGEFGVFAIVYWKIYGHKVTFGIEVVKRTEQILKAQIILLLTYLEVKSQLFGVFQQ